MSKRVFKFEGIITVDSSQSDDEIKEEIRDRLEEEDNESLRYWWLDEIKIERILK